MAAIVTNPGERRMLSVALLNIGLLTVKLIKAPFAVDPDAVPGDFTEANYDGYAPQLLVYTGLEAGSPGGRAIADFLSLTFTCTGALTPNAIYGYWVEDAFGEVVIQELFTGAARPMVVAGQNITISVTLRLWCPVGP